MLLIAACGLSSPAGCSSDTDSTEREEVSSAAVLDLDDVKRNPDAYAWFDFRPNLKKLILAGSAETEHIAILWYTIAEGSVGLHYHLQTESVYVIDGTQTDAKGVFETGTVYFNPPGSGHAISDSSGFFLLAYASPPDFANTALIGEYTPVEIDTEAADLTSAYAFEATESGARAYAAPLDATGGISAEFIETTTSTAHAYTGNYLLVLEGSCDVDGVTLGENMLVVAETLEPRSFAVSASPTSSCLAMGLSF